MQRGDTQPEWSISPPNNIDVIEVLGSSADRPTIPPTSQSGPATPHSLNDTGAVGTAILGIEVLVSRCLTLGTNCAQVRMTIRPINARARFDGRFHSRSEPASAPRGIAEDAHDRGHRCNSEGRASEPLGHADGDGRHGAGV